MQVMLKKIRPSPKQAKVNICFCQKSYRRHYTLSLLNSPEGYAKKIGDLITSFDVLHRLNYLDFQSFV